VTTLCKKCGYTRQPSDAGPEYACPKCQAVYAKVDAFLEAKAQEEAKLRHARDTRDWSGIDPKVLRAELGKITVTTTPSIPGHIITRVIDVVSADYAYAFGALFESIGGIARNLVGSGRSGQTISFLKEGRSEVLSALRFRALEMGATAIIGIKIDYEEFSGANNQGIIVVTATGTAVATKPSA
jgi:uncharacterized protein YbjQ (UPF0145 family)